MTALPPRRVGGEGKLFSWHISKGKWIFTGNRKHLQQTDIPGGIKHKHVTHWNILKLRTAACPLNSITKRVTVTPGLSLERGVFVITSCAIGMAVCICSHLLTSGALFCAGSQVPSEELHSRLLHDLMKRADTHDSRSMLIIHLAISQWNARRGCEGRWVGGRSPRGSSGIVASTEGSHVIFWPVTATEG